MVSKYIDFKLKFKKKKIKLKHVKKLTKKLKCQSLVFGFLSFLFIAASIAFIMQPIGSVASGIVLEPLGRKKSMILVNAPHILGWLLLYYASSITDLYIAGKFVNLF